MKKDCIYLYTPIGDIIQMCPIYEEIVYRLDCENCDKYIKSKKGQYKK